MIWCNSVCNLIYCNCCSLTCTDCNATINKRYDWILVALVYGYSSGVVTAVGVCYGYRVGIWRCDGQVGSRVSGRPLEVAIAFSSERDFGYVAGEKLRAGVVGDGNRRCRVDCDLYVFRYHIVRACVAGVGGQSCSVSIGSVGCWCNGDFISVRHIKPCSAVAAGPFNSVAASIVDCSCQCCRSSIAYRRIRS